MVEGVIVMSLPFVLGGLTRAIHAGGSPGGRIRIQEVTASSTTLKVRYVQYSYKAKLANRGSIALTCAFRKESSY